MNSKKWLDFSLLGIIVILSTMTFLLTRENQELKAKIEDLTNPSNAKVIPDDWRAASITVRDLNNRVETLGMSRRAGPTLLLVFNTSCPHCEHNLPIWTIIAQNLDRARAEIIGLSSDGVGVTAEYFKQNKLVYDVYCIEDSTFRTNYKIGGVPQTILVTADGIIKNVWWGRLNAEEVEGIIQEISALQTI